MTIRILLLLAASSALLDGCGDESSVCSPGTTIECLCSTGAPGRATCATDGAGFGACECFVTDDAGAGTCGPATCGGGCCDLDGTCRDGSELGACGSSGAACMACGTGQLCERGSCIIDGASRWKIRVLDALVPTTKTSGEAWDGFGGAPDPAVIVRSGTRMLGFTPEAGDVFEATFNYTTPNDVTAEELMTDLVFEVVDVDAAANDTAGACRYSNLDPQVILGGATQTLECPRDASASRAGFSLRWQVTRR